MGLRPHYTLKLIVQGFTMKCANPTLCYIEQDTGKRLFRSWDKASDQIKQTDRLVFNCGKCLFCRKKNSLELARRCVLHASLYEQNCFITLTYDEDNLGENKITYSDIQKFKKRLRKKLQPKKVEIFNVHEYGKNGRKHWHLVIFNHDFTDKELFTVKNGNRIYTSQTLKELWPCGHNTIGEVTEASALYQAQYTQKDIKNGNTNNDRKAKSNHSGIGRGFFLRNFRQILSLGYIPFGKTKMPIPRYFEKLAHKHWCHFNDQTAFFDQSYRKRIYTPFKTGQENKQIADLYAYYLTIKHEKIKEMEEQWNEVIMTEFDTKEKPDFIKSAENALYQVKQKQLTQKEKF